VPYPARKRSPDRTGHPDLRKGEQHIFGRLDNFIVHASDAGQLCCEVAYLLGATPCGFPGGLQYRGCLCGDDLAFTSSLHSFRSECADREHGSARSDSTGCESLGE
jgi:hypothetical protein